MTARRRAAATASIPISSSCTPEPEVGIDELHARPGGVLVPVRDYNTLTHLDWVVGQTPTERATSSC